MKIQQEAILRVKQIVDPEMVLQYLGFHIIRRTPKELRGPCKVHGGDNYTAFRMNLETKTWSCYSRHCEAEGYRDLIGLVQKTLSLPFVDSVRLLADIAGVNLDDQDELSTQFIQLKHEQEIAKEVRIAERQSSVTSLFPEEIVAEFLPHRSNYFIERGFPVELLDFF